MRFFAPLDNEPSPSLLEIEVATSFQIPSFHVIGLPAPEVSEARERIRAAIENSGLEFPRRRLVVNLSPASVKKRGTGLDLAIALAILENREALNQPGSLVASGELSLDGRVRSAGGVTRTLFAAWQRGARRVYVPQEDLRAALAARRLIVDSGRFLTPCPEIVSIATLHDAWSYLRGTKPMAAPLTLSLRAEEAPPTRKALSLLPLAPFLRRVILAASAGLHHILLLGPKGVGKTHAMIWLESLQPDRSPELQLHHALLAELQGSQSREPSAPPVRRLNPQVRPFHLIGSAKGQVVRPGEFSLAHGGLLIADEFPEWPRDSRECLRMPLENGTVSIPGSRETSELPAKFLFAGTGNLCPCGGWPREIPIPDASDGPPAPAPCTCPHSKRQHYDARLSGPVLDRIDIATRITSAPPDAETRDSPENEREKLEKVRETLRRSWGTLPGLLSGAETEQLIQANKSWRSYLAGTRVTSLRSRHKVTRVALTLAALDGEAAPSAAHFAEASFYRPEALQK